MCDMIQVGSSVSRRTPTRRTRTAWLSKACWRPTSRACGPSSSTAPPTSLPSSTRWLGERRATHDTTAKSRYGLIWTGYPRDELESLSRINPAKKKKKSVCFICTCHSLIIGSQLLCVINAKTCTFPADISISRCPWASDAWCHSVLALCIWGWSWMVGSPNGSRTRHRCCSLLPRGQEQRTHLRSVDL